MPPRRDYRTEKKKAEALARTQKLAQEEKKKHYSTFQGPSLIDTELMPLKTIDKENPRSLYNLITDEMRRTLDKMDPKMLAMSESELKALVEPTPIDNRLRLAFWQEYLRAQATGQRMDPINIYAGVCHSQYFDRVIWIPGLMAWLLCQPSDYKTITEEALAYGMERVREILELPMIGPNGKVDTKVAEIILKTVALLDLRVKGAVIQRSLLGIVSSPAQQPVQPQPGQAVLNAPAVTDMETLNQRMKDLEKRAAQSYGIQAPRRVEATVVEPE